MLASLVSLNSFRRSPFSSSSTRSPTRAIASASPSLRSHRPSHIHLRRHYRHRYSHHRCLVCFRIPFAPLRYKPDSLASRVWSFISLNGHDMDLVCVVRPPTFGKGNYQKYAQALFAHILRGSDSELPIIASELGRSAEAIVTLARPHSRRLPNEQQPEPSTYGPSEFARELLLLIANRKFCRLTVAESPLTAIIFFE